MKQELITILIAMAPTLEAHAAIATGMGVFKFSATKSFILSAAGTVAITPFLLIFWNYISDFFMRRLYIANKFLTWLFTYTRRKHAHHFDKYGKTEDGEENPETKKVDFWKAFALYVFVAVPGPFTGVWGGTVAAFVFGIPFKHSAIALILGAISVALIDVLVISGFLQLLF